MVDLRSTKCSRWAIRTFAESADVSRDRAKIDPKRTPQEILHDLEKDHPPADRLLQTFRDVLGGLRQFIVDQQDVTIPSSARPSWKRRRRVHARPDFRVHGHARPYEKVAKEAFFNVTLPEANWSREQVEEHMASFNRGTVISTAIHEVYPATTRNFCGCSGRPRSAQADRLGHQR